MKSFRIPIHATNIRLEEEDQKPGTSLRTENHFYCRA